MVFHFYSPQNYENFLYLNPGNFIFDLSSIPGLFYRPNVEIVEFLNFDSND
jgi:hypothetical protein